MINAKTHVQNRLLFDCPPGIPHQLASCSSPVHSHMKKPFNVVNIWRGTYGESQAYKVRQNTLLGPTPDTVSHVILTRK
jgi:hypothetical protein